MKHIVIHLKNNILFYYFLSIILLGCFLRIYDMGKRDLWYDELYSITLAKQSISQNIKNLENNHPPLYQIILHFWIKFFGSGKIAVRSLSMIFGVVSIWLIYEVSRLLFEQKTALISAFLLAISNFHIHYSQETRGYAMFAMLALTSFFFLIKSLETHKSRFFIYYFISTSFLYYAHNYSLFVIFAQNLYFLLRWKEYKDFRFKWFSAQVGAFSLFLPWLPSLFKQIEKKHFIIFAPHTKEITEAFKSYIDLGKRNIILLSFLLIFFIILLLIKKEKQLQPNYISTPPNKFNLEEFDKALLLSLWLVSLLFIPIVISKFFLPIYLLRYSIPASVALYIIIAKLISNLR